MKKFERQALIGFIDAERNHARSLMCNLGYWLSCHDSCNCCFYKSGDKLFICSELPSLKKVLV